MKLVLIDGHNTFIRHYVVNPTMDVNGEPVGGTVGMIKAVKSYMRDMKPDRLIVVWDGEGGSQRRRTIYSEYKAGRKVRLNREFDSNDGANEDLVNMQRQYQMTHKYLRLLGVCQVQVDNVEADDVISFISRGVFEDEHKVIISSDKDMLQLVDEKCQVFNPLKKQMLDRDAVVREHGVLPENYILTKVLCGDGSDNIKGVKGIGEKTATKLFPFIAERSASLNEIFQHATDNLKKSAKYQSVLDEREHLNENMKLMNLDGTLMSASAARAVRTQLDQRHGLLNKFDTELQFMKDGLQIKDGDLFGPFKEYSLRRKYGKKLTTEETDGE